MDPISIDDLKTLIEAVPGRKVSIYVPTHRITGHTDQDKIRLKNSLDASEERLVEAGLRRPAAKDLLAPARALLSEEGFWKKQSDGLALFLWEEGMRRYRLPHRFEEFAAVSDAFHIKPLVPLVSRADRFFILALSLGEIRLLQGNGYSADYLQVEQMPENIAEALRYDDLERRLQFHTTTESPSGPGDRAAQFYGHGVGDKDDKKERILRYFQQIAAGVYDKIGEGDAPLVLAGVDYLHPIYRQASDYPQVIEGGIHGNPEELSVEELHKLAWELVSPHLRGERDRAVERYHALKEGPQASNEIGEIISAGYRGLIDSLFVSREDQLWGTYEADQDEIDIHAGPDGANLDLLDLAAARTVAGGGEVFALSIEEIPDQEKIAALFRDGME